MGVDRSTPSHVPITAPAPTESRKNGNCMRQVPDGRDVPSQTGGGVEEDEGRDHTRGVPWFLPRHKDDQRLRKYPAPGPGQSGQQAQNRPGRKSDPSNDGASNSPRPQRFWVPDQPHGCDPQQYADKGS